MGQGRSTPDGSSAAPDILNPTRSTKTGAEYLHKSLSIIVKSDPEKEGFRVELVDSNLYRWRVYLFDFPNESQISQDLKLFEEATGKKEVCLEVTFPSDFPDSPPFIRVIYPRFHQYTGHITIGGSLCVKELTRSGWSRSVDFVSLFIFLRNLLIEGGALVDMTDPNSFYSEQEARDAFKRVAEAHGWQP
eukprot:TRINITY_DN5768_c0_g1_i1.p1 TRINITY_DN5768_c0_g1~~TRINITY_DN5768_c0_g1_i1.p1  ORF type:complete len:190 (-),score=23.41 TRINITY_DN5768_c0_g1_i1:58-627(-)